MLGCCSDAGVFCDLTRSVAKARALVRRGRLQRSQTGNQCEVDDFYMLIFLLLQEMEFQKEVRIRAS